MPQGKYAGDIEEFLGKTITLIAVHTEGIKFSIGEKVYDTLNGQSVYELDGEE